MEEGMAGLWGLSDDLSLLSVDPPGRLPMIVDEEGLETGGEGDLDGLEGRRGTSTGGSWSSVICEGVWLREERWVTVGETAGGQVSEGLPTHRTEGINPGLGDWRRGEFRVQEQSE